MISEGVHYEKVIDRTSHVNTHTHIYLPPESEMISGGDCTATTE